MRFAYPLLGALLASVLVSCTSSDGKGSSSGGGCKDYDPPASFDAQNPKVSFKTDVMGVFKQSCAFSTCHGATTGSANGVFLGSDPAKVRAAIVDVKSDVATGLVFVKPGDPKNSFLMKKMDASQCTINAQCAGGTCGDSMPKGSETLPAENRDVVRRWIAQGALDN